MHIGIEAADRMRPAGPMWVDVGFGFGGWPGVPDR